ncbi:MAG: serine hydrolase [Bacteroidales bacterium]|nr:serine hydrolase [Bacteroidales bacterium]
MVLFVLLQVSQAQDSLVKPAVETEILASSWSDSVLQTLTLNEKIAQLLMLRTYSDKDSAYYAETEAIIKKYNPGGLCFFQGGPVMQTKLTNRYQAVARTPVFIAMDAEWGAGMRLDSCHSFPFNMTFGSVTDDSLIYKAASEIARQMKLMGVHINFAPVVDINNNPANPVINSRSFGEDKNNVAQKGIAYMRGLQDNGIIATAKHFPGHGDTGSDSHYTLPVIDKTTESIDSIELFPFKQLIDNGLDGVMVAHLFIPSLDSTPNTPTTLSQPVVTGLLRKSLGFDGLVITDALDMKGVTIHHKPGDIELKALMAGNDILLLPQDIGAAIDRISQAVEDGTLSEDVIDQRCKKILLYKEKAGLAKWQKAKTDSLYEQLSTFRNELLDRKIFEEAITLLKNDNDLIPLQKFDSLKIASVSIGSPSLTPFQEMLGNYTKIDHFNILKKFTPNEKKTLLHKLEDYNLVIIGIHNTNIFPSKNFGIDPDELNLAGEIADSLNTVLCLFASPYSLEMMNDPASYKSIILGHQDTRTANEIAARIIMGNLGAKGKLPVTVGDKFKTGGGIETLPIGRLGYTIPEEMGIDAKDLEKIDRIVLKSIADKATPGCQVLVAVDGNVIYQKSFGYHTYVKGNFVKNTDIYDLASITKVAATTLSIMKLYDERKMDIDHRLVSYLPFLNGSNKENLVIRDVMTHQARLKSWIPFYLNTLDKKGNPDKKLYGNKLDAEHTVQVADHLFINRDYGFVMIDSIVTSGLRKKRDYKYSDLGFYLLKISVENITNKPLDKYVDESFYKSLGLQYTGFNPLSRFDKKVIVPTEKDDYFRHQLVHGFVHDPGAAMLGGVSGHAGLFGNANDLAIIFQMLLQDGFYGGIRYVKPETVEQFTAQQFPLNDNRRGLGFDKPEPVERDKGPTCKSASLDSFGHTGFTGTYCWADPKYNLVYIFLSNRVNPTASNIKLIRQNIRTDIQQAIYDALKGREQNDAGNEIGRLEQMKIPN